MTLRIKILAAITLVLGVTVGASFLVLIRYQRAQLLRNTTEATSHLANTIRATLEHAMLANDPAEIRRIVSTVGAQPGIVGVYVLDSRGTVRVASTPTERGQPLPERPSPILRSRSPIPNSPRCQGCHPSAQPLLGQLVVDRSPEAMEEQLRTSLGYMLASAGLAFLLLTATTYAVLRRLVVTPLADLGRAARAIQAGRYDTPLTLQTSDEVGELARTLDQMRGRIVEHLEEIRRWGEELEGRVAERTEELRRSQAEILQRQRRIAALEAVRAATVTLSHHINNATAGIAGCRDVLASALAEETDWQIRYALDGIQTSVRRITAVLQALRDLVRIDVMSFPGGLEAIDVDRAIQEKLARLQMDGQIADASTGPPASDPELPPQVPHKAS